MYPFYRLCALVFALVLIATSTIPTFAQAKPLNQEDPRLRDAKTYAANYSVDLDEAVRRLQLQDPAGELSTLT